MLEAVLVAGDPVSVLTRHVGCELTGVVTLARAHSALESRARPGRVKAQPFASLAFGLVEAALEELERVRLHVPAGRLDAAVAALNSIAAGGVGGVESVADCRAKATLVQSARADLRAAVIAGLAEVWRGGVTPDAGQSLAREMAALCVIEGRQHHLLDAEVRAALSRGRLDADQLSGVLLPAKREVRVAVVVEGTSRLEGLGALMDPTCVPSVVLPGDPVVGWGRGAFDLKALVEMARHASDARRAWSREQAGGQVVLTFTVCARDVGGAALLGRQRASELLDQYVAGQRTSEIRLRPETLAFDPVARRILRLSVPVLGARPVRPLTMGWPSALRESLRTAHIARVTEAPTTAAGLCWAALEALEVKVKPDSVSKLARALSLQAVRQQVVDLHQRTRTAVAAEVAAVRAAHRDARAIADRLEAVAREASGEHAVTVARKAAAARAAAAECSVALDGARRAEAQLKVLDARTGVGSDGVLRRPDDWLDALSPPADADPAVQTAADALADLLDFLKGETAVRLHEWRAMLADPVSLAAWIEKIAKQFKTSLDWLYVIRNTALHDGQFVSASDLLDVHSGRALVDMTLEFLGNWFQHEDKAAPEHVALPAIRVIGHLAQRQEEVLSRLRGGSREGWTVARLTSPTSTGWDRTRAA
ncbi:hypothetical protein [Streptomyces sp. NPDC048643]|uniref:hypothetical protein n=1 Tax=Streptomyces sp. NPDC048643 TaxID=3155637 RepID=UPI003443195F